MASRCLKKIKWWHFDVSSLHKRSLWLNVHRNNPQSVTHHERKRNNKPLKNAPRTSKSESHNYHVKLILGMLCQLGQSSLRILKSKHSVHRLLLDFWFNTQWWVNSHIVQINCCCVSQFSYCGTTHWTNPFFFLPTLHHLSYGSRTKMSWWDYAMPRSQGKTSWLNRYRLGLPVQQWNRKQY